jgi:photosystem II stability/assembly factor-like uncharacterized protein
MKRLFALVPTIFLALFLLNSFVTKEKILKSTDGGETWQEISEGSPKIEQPVNFPAAGLYKSPNKGEILKQIQKGLILNIVESEGVLIATGAKGVMRSTDNGEHWQWVISEGGVGIAVERIKGGFAAISYNTETKSRRIRISLDRGETWQAIDKGLPPSSSISSIKQMGKYLICGHPDGIFRSSDMGKTWNKVHPGVDKTEFRVLPAWNTPFTWTSPSSEPIKVFKIDVSGNVLYAVPGSDGC